MWWVAGWRRGFTDRPSCMYHYLHDVLCSCVSEKGWVLVTTRPDIHRSQSDCTAPVLDTSAKRAESSHA